MFEAVCIMTPPNRKIYHVGEMMPCRSMKKYKTDALMFEKAFT